MKVWLKRILIGLVALLIVALVGTAIFLLTFDPNAYKSRLEQMVYDRYHRTLSIDGDIELSLFPRIGLTVSDVSLTDRDSTQHFASIGDARLAVAIWPLLWNRLVVDYVSVNDFKAWLVRTKDGQFNFSDLVSVPALPASQTLSTGPHIVGAAQAASDDIAQVNIQEPADKTDLQIDIAGLELHGGELHLDDQRTNSRIRMTELSLTTGRMTYDQAFDVALQGRLRGNRPTVDAPVEARGRMRINPLRQSYAIEQGNINVTGQLGGLQAEQILLQGGVAYNAFLQTIGMADLRARVVGDYEGRRTVKNLNFSATVPDLSVDRSRAEFKVSDLALRLKGEQQERMVELAVDAPSLAVSPDSASGAPVEGSLKLSGDDTILGVSMALDQIGGDAYHIRAGKFDMEAAWQRDDQEIGVNMSSPLEWRVFQRRAALSAIKGDMKIHDPRGSVDPVSVPFIGSLSADAWQDDYHADLNAVVDGGKVDFTMQASRQDSPAINFDLMADRLNLNALLPTVQKPETEPEEAQEGQEKAAEEAEGQQRVQQRPTNLDWRALTGLDLKGGIAIDQLHWGDLALDHLRAGVRAGNDQFAVEDIKAGLYGGTLDAGLELTADQLATLDLSIVDVNYGALTRALTNRQRLAGKGDVRAKLISRGKTWPALLAGLTGDAKINVTNGAWVGVDFSQAMDDADDVLLNAFSGQLPRIASHYDASRRTRFDTLDVALELANGQGRFNRIELVAPDIRINEAEPASVDLVSRRLDVLLHILATGEGNQLLTRLGSVGVPLLVSGPFDDLVYAVQWKNIRDRVVKDAIQEGLLDNLSGPSGDVAESFLPDESGETNPKSETQDSLERVGDILKGLLKK